MKDRRTGEPTGVLKDGAIDMVTRVVPSPGRAEKLAALRAAIAEAHKVGITSVQSVSRTDEELELLDEIRKEGDLTVRVYASIGVSPALSETELLELNRLRDEFPDDPALKLGGVAVMCPCDAAQLERTVTLLDKHNWHVMVRTLDGSDVHEAVEAFDRAVTENPATDRDRRNRIDESLLANGTARILSGSRLASRLAGSPGSD